MSVDDHWSITYNTIKFSILKWIIEKLLFIDIKVSQTGKFDNMKKVVMLWKKHDK